MADKQGHFDYYMKYSEALRNWIVVYGVGGVVLLHDEGEAIGQDLIAGIAVPFFIAVFAQVVTASVNKWDHWTAHAEQEPHPHVVKRIPGGWLLRINIWADVISLVSLVVGSCCLALAL